MPATENDRRNLQQPTLDKPSLPDHDRTRDDGMHQAQPATINENADEVVNMEEEGAAPDQEFEQLMVSGTDATNGLMPDDPNNWLTSDPEKGEYREQDPENRGDSLPDLLERDRH